MRGTKPQPTALRVLRGNPGKRPLNTKEPQHAPLATDCPPELVAPAARVEWDRVAPGLIACGQVTEVDRAVLIGYCDLYAQWLMLKAEAAAHPSLIKGAAHTPMANPAYRMQYQAYALMVKSAAELGITPSSRSRVVTTPTTPKVSKWA